MNDIEFQNKMLNIYNRKKKMEDFIKKMEKEDANTTSERDKRTFCIKMYTNSN
jgi:hypothetical protein